jgi:MFS family permease
VAGLESASQTLGSRLGQVGNAYLDVVRSPRYFPLWLGQLVSNFGDTLHYIALVVLVFQLTGQGTAVAVLVAAEILPVLLLGPVAGVVIDRFSRKAVLIGADLVRAALVLSLLWPQGVWHTYLVAAGLAAGNTFFNPTVQAVIPALTTEDQRLAANSVSWSTGRLVQILASAIAGGLIAFLGTRVAFGLNAVTFVVSALLIAQLRIPAHAGQLGEGTKRGLGCFFADARDGLRFARRDRFVSRLLVVQSLASFAVGATSALLIVLAEKHLHLPPAGFAWLIAAIGVGALIGPLIPNVLATDYRKARWLFVPYVIRGIGDVFLAIVTPLPLAMLILFVYGLNTSTGMVVFSSTVQDVVPDAVRGRVFTLLDVSWNTMRLLSLVVGGLVVDTLGIQPLFWGGGTLLALAGGLGLVLLGSYDFRQDPAAGQDRFPQLLQRRGVPHGEDRARRSEIL